MGYAEIAAMVLLGLVAILVAVVMVFVYRLWGAVDRLTATTKSWQQVFDVQSGTTNSVFKVALSVARDQARATAVVPAEPPVPTKPAPDEVPVGYEREPEVTPTANLGRPDDSKDHEVIARPFSGTAVGDRVWVSNQMFFRVAGDGVRFNAETALATPDRTANTPVCVIRGQYGVWITEWPAELKVTRFEPAQTAALGLEVLNPEACGPAPETPLPRLRRLGELGIGKSGLWPARCIFRVGSGVWAYGFADVWSEIDRPVVVERTGPNAVNVVWPDGLEMGQKPATHLVGNTHLFAVTLVEPAE